MITKELLSYVKRELADGFTREQIRGALVGAGWVEKDIEEAFKLVSSPEKTQETSPSPSPQPASPALTSSSEVSVEQPALSKELSLDEELVALPDMEMPSKQPTPNILQEEKHGKSKTSIFVVVMILLSILFVASGVFAYFSYFKRLSPNEVFARMFEALQTITSNRSYTEFSVNLKANSEEMGSGKLQASILTDGARDISDQENVKARGSINLKVDASSGLLGIKFELGVDVKVLEGIVYVRLSKITDMPIPVDFSSIKGKWVKIDPKELEKEFGAVAGMSSYYGQKQDVGTSQGGIKENKELRDKALTQLKEFSQELENIAARGVTEGEDEKINGVNTYHYNIAFSKEDWRIIIEKLSEIGMDVASETGTNTASSVKELEDFKSSDEFDQLLDILAMIKTEVWIGKKDFLPYKTIAELKFDEFKFDDPLSVAREKARQAGLKANLSSMRPSAEIFYDSNSNSYGVITKLGICPESGSIDSMFTQNRSIASAISSIKTITEGEVYCVAADGSSGAQKYAISAPFKDGSDSWCVDSSGFFGSGTAGEDAKCGKYISATDTITKKTATLNGNILFKYSSSDYNEPITVEAPEKYVPFIEIMGNLAGQTLGNIGVARERARTASVQSFLSGVLPAAVICVDDNQKLKKPEDVNTGGGNICKDSISDWPALPDGWSYDGPDVDIAPDVTSNIEVNTFTYTAYRDGLIVTCTENGCVKSE